jgi:hypothetical protein
MRGAITTLPLVSITWFLIKHMDNFTLISQLTKVSPAIYKKCYQLLGVRGCIQKFPDWPPGVKTENGTALCH